MTSVWTQAYKVQPGVEGFSGHHRRAGSACSPQVGDGAWEALRDFLQNRTETVRDRSSKERVLPTSPHPCLVPFGSAMQETPESYCWLCLLCFDRHATLRDAYGSDGAERPIPLGPGPGCAYTPPLAPVPRSAKQARQLEGAQRDGGTRARCPASAFMAVSARS